MLDKLTVEDFQPRLEETFRLDRPDGDSMDLRLVEAAGTGGTPTHRQPFSVVFEGPPEPILGQSIYRLHNDAMGTLEIFLVPLGLIGGGIRYESVFT
jgi:hypothetical protein